MPTKEDLGKLATELYKEHPTVGAYDTPMNLTLDTSKASSMGFTGSRFFVWTGDEDGSYNTYERRFYSSSTSWRYDTRDRSGVQAVCIGE